MTSELKLIISIINLICSEMDLNPKQMEMCARDRTEFAEELLAKECAASIKKIDRD